MGFALLPCRRAAIVFCQNKLSRRFIVLGRSTSMPPVRQIMGIWRLWLRSAIPALRPTSIIPASFCRSVPRHHGPSITSMASPRFSGQAGRWWMVRGAISKAMVLLLWDGGRLVQKTIICAGRMARWLLDGTMRVISTTISKVTALYMWARAGRSSAIAGSIMPMRVER